MKEENLTIKNLIEIITQLTKKTNKLREYIIKIRTQISPVIEKFQQKSILIKQNVQEKAAKLIAYNGKYEFGGLIAGFGGGDTIPIMVEPGEWVIKKTAVKNYGTNFLSALNNITFDQNKLPNAVQEFADNLAEINNAATRKKEMTYKFTENFIPQVEQKNNIVLDFKGGRKITLQGTKDMVEALITQLRHERLTTI
jgi:hypothetical protein